MNTPNQQPLYGSIKRGNTHYYNSEQAVQKIATLKSSQIRIYGIDAAILTKNTTQPFLEHSIDFGKSEENWDQATAFIISKANLGLMFEIVSDEAD